MSPNTVTASTESISTERERQVAKLNKALYPADRQAKYLDLQAEVEKLLTQLQSLSATDCQ
jgi:hypothetical protein